MMKRNKVLFVFFFFGLERGSEKAYVVRGFINRSSFMYGPFVLLRQVDG